MIINRNINIKLNVYTFICIIFSIFCVLKVLRGADYSSTQVGGIWNYISLLYYPILIYSALKKRYMKVSSIFVFSFLFCLGAMISVLVMSDIAYTKSFIYRFLMVPYFFLVLSSFYLNYEDNRFCEKVFLFTYYVCLFINMYTIMSHQFMGASRPMASDVYYSLGLLPFMLAFEENTKRKNLFLIMQFITIFLADKRTGLIGFLSAFTIYYIIDNRATLKTKLKIIVKRIIFAVVILICMYGCTLYLDSIYGLNIYSRLFNVVEDGGSGRSAMYVKLFNAFTDSNFINQLFGHGINAAGSAIGASYVHNDFLQVLYDYGIINLILFILFYLAIFIAVIKMISKKSKYAGVFAFSLIIGLFLSMFSYFLVYYTYVTCIVAFWGVILAKERNNSINPFLKKYLTANME